MIGEVLQYILDKGFFVRFTYDGNIGYVFRAWKFYEDDVCTCEWTVSDSDVSQGIPKEMLIRESDMYLKIVDDNISQRRLIDSTLK